MEEPQEPADGTNGTGQWFTPQERARILQRAYPCGEDRLKAPPGDTLRGRVLAWLSALAVLAVAMASPLVLACHAILRLTGRRGLLHTVPGEGSSWRFNMHAFKRVTPGHES